MSTPRNVTLRIASILAIALLWSGPTAAYPEEPEGAQAPAAPTVPAEGQARRDWIAETLGAVIEGDQATRRAGLRMLIEHDVKGDTLEPVVALLSDSRVHGDALVDVVRAVGIDQLEPARDPLLALLTHDQAEVRGNAAVSLEYVGGASSVADLKKALKREKIESVRAHLCRALGRCGAGERSVRSLLLKHVKKAEASDELVGPVLGLAYFEGDRGAARKLEARLAKLVVPKGITDGLLARRGAKLIGWVLSEIADPKTPAFLRDDVMKRLRHGGTTSQIVTAGGGGELEYYDALARKIEGDPSARDEVDAAFEGGTIDVPGVGAVSSAGGVSGLGLATMDAMRKGRDMRAFRPKGDRAAVQLPSSVRQR